MDQEKICPFRGGDGLCKRERCAIWFQIKRDDGTVKYEGCSITAMSRAAAEISANGIDVYPQ